MQVGSGVQLNGIFVQTPPGKSPVQDWLNPLWEFRGKMQSIDAVTSSSRWDAKLRNLLVGTVPGGDTALVDVALSMVIGHAAPISQSMQNLFLEAGVTHLLAASGANVVIFIRTITVILSFCMHRLSIYSKWLETAFLLASITVFVYICGFSPPIVRAALFSAYSVCGRALGRSVSTGTAMSVVCILFVFWQPYQFTTVSALFSLVATYAMYCAVLMWRLPQTALSRGVLHSRIQSETLKMKLVSALHLLIKHGLELLYISVVIDLTMLPLVWWWFGQLTPYGAIATVAAEPFVVVLLPLTICWTILSVLGMFLHIPFLGCAMLVGHVVIVVVGLLIKLLHAVAGLPGSLLKMPSVPVWLVGLYFMILVVWLNFRPQMLLFRQHHKTRVV